MENFEQFKKEILARAKAAKACREEYSRALKAESFGSLMEVVRDNFHWAVHHSVIDGSFIDKWRDEFAAGNIWHNHDVESGYLLVTEGSFMAQGNATVKACDNATVEACDNATVKACDNATVEACDNATVEACDNATVKAWGNATVKACDNATVKACDNATVEAWGNATVKAWGNAYITSYSIIDCKLEGHSVYRVRKTNTIYYVDKDMKFQLIKDENQ